MPKAGRKARKKKPNASISFWLRLLISVTTLAIVVVGVIFWMFNSPIDREKEKIDAHVSSGLGARAIAEELASQGLYVNDTLFALAARFTGKAGQLKAGRYDIPNEISTLELLDFLSKGQGVLSSVSLIEGQTAQAYLDKLRQLPDLVNDLPNESMQTLADKFGVQGGSLEGWLYPDTYRYSPGSTLSHLLERAVRLQQEELAKAWSQRSRDQMLKDPYEVLVLASIIEKETGQAADRPLISSVFHNRLKIGMLLQTDPTVIYGVPNFDGNLTRKHLTTDHPWNTYTRPGLPPTPIANPGRASLYAAVRPENSGFLYFVARGDGSSQFSTNLRDHNNAVRKYQLNR